MKYLLLSLLLIACLNDKKIDSPYSTGIYSQYAVVSPDILASKIAADILKEGGNSFDAAIALQFALAVIHPQAGDLGGGGFMVYHLANGKVSSLDFREQAPLASTPKMYLDKKGNVIKGLSTYSALAVGVPGLVDGMVKLHKKYATMPWKKLIQYSIDLAEKGYRINKNIAALYNKYQKDFIKITHSKHPYIKNTPWKAGDKVLRLKLAKTLNEIRDFGRKGFYEGSVAKAIVEEMKARNGIISYQDLKSYRSYWRDIIKANYKDYSVYSMAPPSSGGIVIAQVLAAIEPYNIGKYKFQSTKSIQYLVEAMRRSFADRAYFLGDSDFVKIPQNKLLSKEYIKQRMSDINLKQATKSSAISHGKLPLKVYEESFETAHYSIVDSYGNAVSTTFTLNSNFGSKIYVEKAGFFLNNEMDDFSSKPLTANQYGLIGSRANEIRPKKRMLSSMSPTIVKKNNKLFMVLGAPGGPTIISNVLQTFLNVVEYGMTMQQAVDAPRFHHQYLPDVIMHEPKAISTDVRKNLVKLGYKFKNFNRRVGENNAIHIKGGKLEVGVDSRGKANGAAGL